jgi:hypothetical protein
MTIDLLMNGLLRIRPHGWSVTRSGESLSVRPPDRDRCKFRVRFVSDGSLAIMQFDRALNHWTRCDYVAPSAVNAEAVFEHLRRRTEGDTQHAPR